MVSSSDLASVLNDGNRDFDVVDVLRQSQLVRKTQIPKKYANTPVTKLLFLLRVLHLGRVYTREIQFQTKLGLRQLNSKCQRRY